MLLKQLRMVVLKLLWLLLKVPLRRLHWILEWHLDDPNLDHLQVNVIEHKYLRSDNMTRGENLELYYFLRSILRLHLVQ